LPLAWLRTRPQFRTSTIAAGFKIAERAALVTFVQVFPAIDREGEHNAPLVAISTIHNFMDNRSTLVALLHREKRCGSGHGISESHRTWIGEDYAWQMLEHQ